MHSLLYFVFLIDATVGNLQHAGEFVISAADKVQPRSEAGKVRARVLSAKSSATPRVKVPTHLRRMFQSRHLRFPVAIQLVFFIRCFIQNILIELLDVTERDNRCACATRHTSHITHHTSHVTRHTSHITHHTSHITRHTSHITRHTSHITCHTSQFSEIALQPRRDHLSFSSARHSFVAK